MASVTYGKCYLWQKYYVKCNYGKNIMANETEPLRVYIGCLYSVTYVSQVCEFITISLFTMTIRLIYLLSVNLCRLVYLP